MGIDVHIQDERGGVINELPDPRSLLSRLLRQLSGKESVCVRFIDPYGDTYFNQLQMPVLIQELRAIVDACADQDAKAHGKAVIALVESASERVHTYVRFTGD
jgi:DNA-binding FadR family transcriptional regulator